MPKTADHQARRLTIADAVHRIIDARGMGHVSLREVAAEAGMSMGAVQYYFATKDEMLRAALEHLNARIGLAFLARSVVSDELAGLLRGGLPYIQDFFAGQIRAAQAAGQARAELDADEEAGTLLGLVYGLSSLALVGHHSPETAVRLVDHGLARLTSAP